MGASAEPVATSGVQPTTAAVRLDHEAAFAGAPVPNGDLPDPFRDTARRVAEVRDVDVQVSMLDGASVDEPHEMLPLLPYLDDRVTRRARRPNDIDDPGARPGQGGETHV